jgi:DNA-binding response OmpR family regulator
MTERTSAAPDLDRPASASGAPPLRVAVIDIDSGFLQVLGKRLERLGWERRVSSGPIPVRDLVSLRLGALIVDLACLGPGGWEYLEQVASELPGLGLVVCTGGSTVAQRVRGLRLGADDWVTKPCHPEELIARVEAVVRRRRQPDALIAEPVLSGELQIRADQFQAFADGRSLELTRREFELLALLASAEGRVLEREEIYRRVWGYEMARGDRSVDVFVRKLRQKLDTGSPGWTYIHTHFGVGYRFSAEPEHAEAAQPAASSDTGAESPEADAPGDVAAPAGVPAAA